VVASAGGIDEGDRQHVIQSIIQNARLRMRSDGFIRLIVVAVFVLLLELGCRSGVIDRLTMVPPTEMVVALIDIFRTPELVEQIIASLLNIVIATAMVIVIGFIAGVIIHALPRVRAAVDPLLSSYYALPLFAFYPLFIVLFGIGDLPIILMGFLTGFAAMVLATLNGLDNIPEVLNRVARTYQMGPVSTALRLKLPAAAPYLVTGLQLAIAYGFIGVIASEFILSGKGLGFAISYDYNAFDTTGMYGLILLLILITTALNMALHRWDKKLAARRRRL
jgi:NitT/TauT family transport system permease protein